MNFSGVKKISIYNPIDGVTVQMNNIGTEGDFKSEPFSVDNANGSGSYAGDNFMFNFVAYDNDGQTQLEAWMKNRTPVNMVVFGLDTHILWLEDTLITVAPDLKMKVGELNGMSINVEKKGGVLNIFSGVNIIKELYGFQDANNNGKVDNYDFQPSGLLGTFTANTQTLVLQDAGHGAVQFNMKYPISGAALRFRFNCVTSLQGVDVTITCQSFTGSALSTKIDNINSNIDFVTPSGMYKLSIVVSIDFLAAGDSLSFTQPYLGVRNYEAA